MATISIYDISVTPFLRYLDSLEAFLKKGQAWAKENGKSEDEILSTKLAPDMAGLVFQVQRLTDSMKYAPIRVGKGVENMSMPDEEKTFDDVYARIDKTRQFLKKVPREALDGVKPDDEIVWQIGGTERRIPALGYITSYATPNILFHVTAAYAILRHLGAPVGKRDFLGAT